MEHKQSTGPATWGWETVLVLSFFISTWKSNLYVEWEWGCNAMVHVQKGVCIKMSEMHPLSKKKMPYHDGSKAKIPKEDNTEGDFSNQSNPPY